MLLQEKIWNEDIQRYIFGKWRISKLPVLEANMNEKSLYVLKNKKKDSVSIKTYKNWWRNQFQK